MDRANKNCLSCIPETGQTTPNPTPFNILYIYILLDFNFAISLRRKNLLRFNLADLPVDFIKQFISLWWWVISKMCVCLILRLYSNRENVILAKYKCFTVEVQLLITFLLAFLLLSTAFYQDVIVFDFSRQSDWCTGEFSMRLFQLYKKRQCKLKKTVGGGFWAVSNIFGIFWQC